MRIALALAEAELSLDFDGAKAGALNTIDESMRILDAAGDTSGLSEAWWLRGYVEQTAGQVAAAQVSFRSALENATHSGDTLREARAHAWLGVCRQSGPMPRAEALVRGQEHWLGHSP